MCPEGSSGRADMNTWASSMTRRTVVSGQRMVGAGRGIDLGGREVRVVVHTGSYAEFGGAIRR